MNKQFHIASVHGTGRVIQLCMPEVFEEEIPVTESVRLLDDTLERLDYTKLYRCYSPEGRTPALSPKTLFKILVFAYTQGIYSSRAIESSCRFDLRFKWLLNGEKVPDHNTIARFRKSRLSHCLEDLLSQFVKLLMEMDEVRFEHVFVDGSKLEANANKYSFVWRKATNKYEARLQEQVRQWLSEDFADIELPSSLTAVFLFELAEEWRASLRNEGVDFVQGKGKHKDPRQRSLERLEDYAKRQARYETQQSIFRGRNSFSKTDPDATFMHLKDDHMRNSQLKPAYNLQVAVESEYIVGLDLSSERSDMYTLKPLLERLKQQYQVWPQKLVCDAGYESEENYSFLEEKNIKAFIKPSNYVYSKTRKFKNEMAFRQALVYQEKQDAYVCKNGRTLHFSHYKTNVRPSGFSSQIKIYTCESCDACPYISRCYKGKYNKSIQVNERFDAYRERSLSNVTSDEGVILRVNRSIQAEGVFASLKWNMGFKRYLLRGERNVRSESLLLALAFNLKKLHYRIEKGRIGKPLFRIEVSA